MTLPRRALLVLALTAACASRPALPPAGPRPSATAPVVVYGATWCRHTRAAMDWLERRNVPSQFRNVETEPEAWDEVTARARNAGLNPRGVPVLDVRGRIILGFTAEEVERALED